MHPKRPAPLISKVAMYLSLSVQRGLDIFRVSKRIPASCMLIFLIKNNNLTRHSNQSREDMTVKVHMCISIVKAGSREIYAIKRFIYVLIVSKVAYKVFTPV